MTNAHQLNAALIWKEYWPSKRYAARAAAEEIGATYAPWIGEGIVITDECVCEVMRNRKGNCWCVEATN